MSIRIERDKHGVQLITHYLPDENPPKKIRWKLIGIILLVVIIVLLIAILGAVIGIALFSFFAS